MHTQPLGDDWETGWSQAFKEICILIHGALNSQAETSVTTHHQECWLYIIRVGSALHKHTAIATNCGDDCENTTTHWTTYFKMINFTLCELQLRKHHCSQSENKTVGCEHFEIEHPWLLTSEPTRLVQAWPHQDIQRIVVNSTMSTRSAACRPWGTLLNGVSFSPFKLYRKGNGWKESLQINRGLRDISRF